MLAPRAVPTRSCVSCRTSRAKRDLLRVVRTPDGTVRLDETGRANGRGAYVCRDAACIDGAVTRAGLGRALEATLPPDLATQLKDAVRGGGIDGTQ